MDDLKALAREIQVAVMEAFGLGAELTPLSRQRAALRAIEAALSRAAGGEDARDAERLDFVMRHVRRSELRRIGIHTNGGDWRPAIDAAIAKSREVGRQGRSSTAAPTATADSISRLPAMPVCLSVSASASCPIWGWGDG